MIQGMSAALSGIRAYINGTRSTANNIANLNTPGFRASRVNQASIEGGLGVRSVSTQTIANQGALISTGSPLDVAINGSGFFTVRTPNGGTGYTRAGAFSLNGSGKLVDAGGNLVQGFKLTTDSSGAVTKSGAAGDIELGGTQSAPKETTSFRMRINLDASAAAGSTFSTSFNVYNSQGEEATLTYTFTKQAGPGNAWDYQATGPAGTAVSGPGANGTVAFDSQGNMTAPAADQPLTISGFPSGAADLTAAWDVVDDATGTPNGDVTGFASESAATSITQDGYGTGVLQGYSVGSDGTITGRFSNGRSQPLYQLQMADFSNPSGMSQLGGGAFGETAQSGQPVYGAAGSGGFGSLQGSALETSNVDLAEQMVSLIQNQHGFSAQLKTIQTADETLGSLLNIKA